MKKLTDKEFIEVTDIPEPPKIKRFRDLIPFLIGPAIISVSIGIGTGEIISGPMGVLTYGPKILWIALISVFFQTLSSIIGARYTLATGEPLIVGNGRLWPGKKVWAIVWSLADFFRMMWPYYMMLSGTMLAFIILGRMPEAPDKPLITIMSIIALIIGWLPLVFGRKVQGILGAFSFWDVIVEVGLIVIIALIVTPLSKVTEVLAGFFSFGYLPPGVNWAIIAAIAGYAGNVAHQAIFVTYYYRDTEWGMTKKVGFISGMIGGKKISFLSKGYLPKTDKENIGRLRTWMKYVSMEQWIIYFLGSLITLWLPVALTYHIVPAGAKMPSGWAFPVALAEYMKKVSPILAILVTILILVLYVTNTVTVVDSLPRSYTNLWWYAFPSLDKIFKGDARKLYYTLMSIWSIIWIIFIFIGVAPAWQAILAGAFANLCGVLCYIALLGVNFILLPKEYRMKWWELIIITIGLVFYLMIFIAFILSTFFGIRI
ncbi:MAG: Nramp family divalent metal transporter [Candidatus Micrarchaeia archaeon]